MALRIPALLTCLPATLSLIQAYKFKKILFVLLGFVFSFDFLPPQQAIEAVPPSLAFCASMSERSLRVLAQHDDGTVLMGIPVFFTGA